MKNTYWQHEEICRKHLKSYEFTQLKSYDNIFSLLTSFSFFYEFLRISITFTTLFVRFVFFFFSPQRRCPRILYFADKKKKKKKKINVKREVSIYHHWSYIYNTLHQFIQFSEPVSLFARVYFEMRASILSNIFDYVVVDIPFHWFDRSWSWEEIYKMWIGSFHSLALNKWTIYGATSSVPSLVLGCSSLGSSHLVVMPHLVGWGPPPSPGARIGACVQFGMVGPGVVGCCAAAGWRTSCGNRAIACLQFRKVIQL